MATMNRPKKKRKMAPIYDLDDTHSRKTRPRGKRKPDDLFADVKVKMVMRINGVSRAKALEIISARAAEKAAAEDGEEARPRDGRFMSAEEFFGAN